MDRMKFGNNEIYLKELSERLIKDESLYLESNRSNHALSPEGLKLITNEVKNVLNSLPPLVDPEPHKVVKNLNLRYAIWKWIEKSKLKLYQTMFWKVIHDTDFNGFIEMNCNPMHNGHVHLIKTALRYLKKQSPNGKLIIAIVQKDSENGIKFRTRFDIVYKVCKRISSDIVVVSNGNLLIGDVFTGYTREQKNVQFCYEGGTMAMRVFGEFLAPMIGVKWRFFGTEPFDVTTNEYNNDAKRILPKLGIKPIIVQRI